MNKHHGSSFEDWLKEEGLFESCELAAKNNVIDHKLNQWIKDNTHQIGPQFSKIGVMPEGLIWKGKTLPTENERKLQNLYLAKKYGIELED